MAKAVKGGAKAGAEAWGDLVDLDRLAAWMDSRGLGAGPIGDPVQLTGGTQNILLRFVRDGRTYVLRRPPRHPRMNGSETMRREARVLGALGDSDVPHPRLIAACPEEDVLGAAFYLMEPVDGFNANQALPALHAGDPAIRHAMGLALADGIAALGRVDHVKAGLSDLGRVEGWLERQPRRWRSQLDGYGEYEGWPGPSCIPDVDTVADWLERNMPPRWRPGIIHGDYHLANVLFRQDGPELAAIVDWELTTLGDPLADLGWMLATWPDPEGPPPGTVGAEPWSGFPTAQELIERYAAGSDRDVGHARWYAVLGCYKLGIIQEGTHARAFAGKAPVATGQRLHEATLGLFRRAMRWIDGG